MSQSAKGPFAAWALELNSLGMMVVPCGGEDGKRPLVKGFTKWRSRQSPAFVYKLMERFPNANIAIVTGPSEIVVVDIDVDDPELVTQAEERFGATPIHIQTSRGRHLWYRANGSTRPMNLRHSEGLPIEIKAGPTYVIVPPSINPLSGWVYEFAVGSWDDVRRLQRFDASSLRGGTTRKAVEAITASVANRHRDYGATNTSLPETVADVVQQGHRNSTAFRLGLRLLSSGVPTTQLLQSLERHNVESNDPLQSSSEVVKIARSVIKIHEEGRNFFSDPSFVITNADITSLLPEKRGGDALLLLSCLRRSHPKKGAIFAIATKAMADAGSISRWSEWRIRQAKHVLRRLGFIRLARRGRRYGVHNEPDQFSLIDRSMKNEYMS